jgi:dolichol-phosphate mannosyltransferase
MFTIIVPIYNEEEALPDLKKALMDYLDIAVLPTKILFVNDGSKDLSLKLLQDYCTHIEAFKYISFKENCGLSAALKAGIQHTATDYLGYIDADLQTRPEDFNSLLKYIHEFDFITGIRIKRQDSTIKKISSKVANTVRNWFTKDGLTDTNCPLKVIKTSVAKDFSLYKGSHRFLPALAKLNHVDVKAIEIPHYKRTKGVSKFGIANRLWSSLLFCFVFLWIKKNTINYSIEQKKL